MKYRILEVEKYNNEKFYILESKDEFIDYKYFIGLERLLFFLIVCITCFLWYQHEDKYLSYKEACNSIDKKNKKRREKLNNSIKSVKIV